MAAIDLNPQVGVWRDLYQKAVAAIANDRIEEDLVDILDANRVQDHFKFLLQFNAQKGGSISRQEVQSGKVNFPEGELDIDKASIPQIINIADAIKADEKYACVLLQKAMEQRNRVGFEGLSLPQVAERLYYEERIFHLQLLCELLKFASVQDNNAVPIRMFFEQQVVIDDLCKTILDILTNHEQLKVAPTGARPEHIPEEMALLSNALFYCLHGFSISSVTLSNSLEVLLQFASKLRQKPAEEQPDFFIETPESVYDPAVYHVCASIFTATAYILSNEELLAVNGDNSQQISPRKNFAPLLPEALLQLHPIFIKFLELYLPVSFHCGILFVYIMFLERHNPQMCRDTLTRFATVLLGNPQAIDTVVTLLSEDAMFFMAQMFRMKVSDTERDIHANIAGPLLYLVFFLKKSHYGRLYAAHIAKPRAFYSVFRFWASVFKASPHCGNAFWGDGFTLTLNTALDRNLIQHEVFGEKIWLNLLKLLANSVVNVNTAYQAYQFFDHQRSGTNWDHIFKSMTGYINDFNPNLYAHGNVTSAPGAAPVRPLSPSDVRSWEHIFLFLTAVLEHNEAIRGLIGDHPTWQSVGSIFQFLMCPVPISLKSKMMLTLAAFAKSEKLANLIWDLLDQSELVVQSVITAPIAGSSQTAVVKRREGLAYELGSTESVQQEYPLTRAFLRLMSELIKWPLPTTLGVGKRIPSATGLQPYLSFLCNEVFVKFSARGYTDLTEMWSIATDCLSIMLSLLESYTYREQDAMDCYVEINGRSNLVPRPPGFLLIREISYGSELFKKIVYVIEQGAKRLGYDVAKGKDYFSQFQHAVELSLRVLISVFGHVTGPLAGLNLALGQHLVAGAVPCAVSLARLIGHPNNSVVPLLSVELLSCLTKTQYGLARLFHAHPESNQFLTAFVNQLLNREVEFVGEDQVTSIEGMEVNKNQDNRAGSLKLVMARFLLENITREKPNVAQYYLGYITDFDQPDLASNPCINAIVDRFTEAGPEMFFASEPQLAECYYELLHTLAADTDFCDSTMEFLRDTKNNFFQSQLSSMPPDLPQSFISASYEMHAKAWFFKLLAIEIMLMQENRSYINELLVLLFENLNRNADGGHEMMASHQLPAQRNILQFMIALDYTLPVLTAPTINPQLEEATRVANFRGTYVTDLPALHELLVAERARASAGHLANNQLALVDVHQQNNEEREIFEILNYFRLKNLADQLLNGKVFYFAAWKQLVEVALHTCSGFLLVEQRVGIAYELLENVLNFTSSSNHNSAPFIYHMATLISTLMHHIRRNKQTAVSLSDYELSGQYNMPVPRLQKVFRMLLQTLSRPGSSRAVRGFLYSAVIDYLTITEVAPDMAKLQAAQQAQSSVTWFMEDLGNHYKRMKQDNYETIREFGFGPFLDMVASDAAGTGSVDPWRAVSLALLDKILRYDDKTRADITRFLDERGFLRALIDFESTATGGIVHLLTAPGDLKAEELLYVGKLQLLQRITQTVEGASLLWANFILEKIVNCVFIDYMPDEDSPAKQLIKERYMTLLIPFLDLCIAMLLMLRRNKEFISEFAVFLDRHAEVLAHLLRDRNSPIAQQLVTRIFYLLAEHEDVVNAKLQNKQSRFHAHLLQLLHIFKAKDMWPCYGAPNGPDNEQFEISLDVLNNVLNYCVCLSFRGSTKIMFGPSMQVDAGQSALKGPIPPMSLLAIILSNTMEQHGALLSEIAVLRNHALRVSDIPDIVLSELDPEFALTLHDLTVDEREIQVNDLLHSQIATKDLLAAKLLTVMEVVLTLLWQHLEHYLGPQAATAASSAQQQYISQYYSPARQYQQQQLQQTPYQTLSSLQAQSQSQLQMLQSQQPQQSSTQPLDPGAMAQLRSDAKALLYPPTSSSFSSFSSSRLPGNRPLLDLVTALPANKKGNSVEVVVQKIKELIREPTPLINR